MSASSLRSLSFDTETTGLPPDDESFVNEHRVVDIALVELIDFVETGSIFQEFVNPQRDVPAEATAIHGLTDTFLRDKPLFVEIADRLLAFLEPLEPGQTVELVAHNAPFDMRFLREELARVGRELPGHVRVVDTLPLARQRYPRDGSHTIDALVSKLKIDASARKDFHGAKVDALLLSPIYRHLLRKDELTLVETATSSSVQVSVASVRHDWFPRRAACEPTEQEMDDHYGFVSKMSGGLWERLYGEATE